MKTAPKPKKRTVHRANLVAPNGDVSALCFKKPRAINMKAATWTTSDDATTCKKCLALIAARPR